MGAYDTCDVLPHDRYDYWASAVAQAFAKLDVEPDGHKDINCRIFWREIGRSRIMFASGTPQIVCRTSATIAADHAENIILMFQKRGSATLLHHGKSVDLAPGSIVAMDTRSPYRLTFFDDFEQQILRFPASALGAGALDLSERTAIRIASSFASKLLLAGFSVARDAEAALQGDLEGPLLDLACLTLSAHSPPVGSSAPADRLGQARNYIRANLNSPDLCPQKVAFELGISLRSLQKAFALADDQPSAYIANARLSEVGKALNDPALEPRTIWHIAQAWGFNDPSYFARSFRKRYGMTPRDWRKISGHKGSGNLN